MIEAVISWLCKIHNICFARPPYHQGFTTIIALNAEITLAEELAYGEGETMDGIVMCSGKETPFMLVYHEGETMDGLVMYGVGICGGRNHGWFCDM